MLQTKLRVGMLAALVAVVPMGLSQAAVADDVTHWMKGVVKSVDKGTKTMVVKTSDGVDQTVKWTGKTATTTGKDVGDGVKEGAKVSVKYTEKAGEKTAVAVKDASKATADGAKDVGKATADGAKSVGKELSK
jgi:hypothetical protein